MKSDTLKKNIVTWFTELKFMQYLYLCIFTGIVMRYYLLTTVLENGFTAAMYDVLHWLLIGYVVVSMAMALLKKQYESWLIPVFMVLCMAIGYMVMYTMGDVAALDFMLLLVGAFQVPWKKIGYVYLCVAVSIQLVAMYCVHKGVASDVTYLSNGKERHSFGIGYPTDFAAHILFIMLVYAALREKKITFTEIAVMCIVTYAVYQQTYARNDAVCMTLLCILLLIVKLLDLCRVSLSDYKILKAGGVLMFLITIVCLIAVTYYDPASATYAKLDALFSGRISLSYQGLAEYGISTFGTQVQEDQEILGYAFFLDSSFIRIAIRYGWIFLSLIVYIFYLCYEKAIRFRKDTVIAVLLVMTVFAVTEHHLIEIAYCPVWFMLFAGMKKSSSREKRRLER